MQHDHAQLADLERSEAATRIAKHELMGAVTSFRVLGVRGCGKCELGKGLGGSGGCRSKGQHFDLIKDCVIQDCTIDCIKLIFILVRAEREHVYRYPIATLVLL
jgi:hypothetical protein